MTDSRQSGPRVYTAPRTDIVRDQGPFRLHFNFPGRNLPDHDDGYGPLARVMEAFLDPGTLIPMHQHRDQEIVSWVPGGVMRHEDRQGNRLVTDPEHLMVMNAGGGFWHAERTGEDDPPLRMLQIFVRPHSPGLPATIQHEPLPDPTPDEWRRLVGPDGDDPPLSVRNAVECHDCRLTAGATVAVPSRPGWDTYLYVFDGRVEVGAEPVERTGSALVTGDGDLAVTAREESVLVAFPLDPDAPVAGPETGRR